MSIAPEPTTSRGEITLQPGYFTSSLYIQPLRNDLTHLVTAFTDQYKDTAKPFELFKKLWQDRGWSWLHMRVYDGRARQYFLRMTYRIFIGKIYFPSTNPCLPPVVVERLTETHTPLERIVALFALYTFHMTQPSTSAPLISSEPYIAVPLGIISLIAVMHKLIVNPDTYEAILDLPSRLQGSPHSTRLRPYVVHVLTALLDAQAFHILPRSALRAQNPSVLPRELFVLEGQDPLAVIQATRPDGGAPPTSTIGPAKKKGRPSKRDKARKAKEAFASLQKYVDKNTVYLVDNAPFLPSGSPSSAAATGARVESTHVVLGHAPHTSLGNYLARKQDLINSVYVSDTPGQIDSAHSQAALRRANEAVYERLKQIDAIAAEKGLEVGGEGGEQTGLARVGRAVEELRQCSGSGAEGGILGLLEGAGVGSK
ncbi:hypothetical protein C8Q80DRAFT_62639 [Daedaleopsis nitida]|nr:hypothetical protein C8Q80DRAFT_62639 [Daedaleopsis nitida]